MLKNQGYDSQTGVWNDSLIGNYLWSSANTREASPDVMTPYTWSAVRYGFAQMILLPGYLSVGNICGRVYNNASVGATALQALGLGKSSFDASSKELYGIDPDASKDWNVPLLPVSLWDRALVAGNTLRVMVSVRKAVKSIDPFLASNPAWCEAQLRKLPDLDQQELIGWLNQVLLPYLVRCFWWMAGSAIAQSNVVGKLRRDLLQIVGPQDTVALLSNVSTAEELLASLGVVVGLDRLRRGKISRKEYVRQYGHRGPHEIELSFLRPAEDPAWIDEQLQEMERSPLDVDTLLAEQRGRYEAALGRLQAAVPQKYPSLLRRINEGSRLTRLREAGRSEGIRTLWVARTFALRTGEISGLGEDIFFLELGEVIRLLEGQDNSHYPISTRQAAYHKLAALPQYPTIIMGQFDPFEWASDPNRRADIYDKTQQLNKRFTAHIKGLPGSAGCAEGRVRILNSPEEGTLLQPSEILVAVTTNVGWTPIFPRAAAVVTDVGAPLSHAAIVARELGIPAVVGCFNATAVLKTGDHVRVDGSTGTVTILDGQSK